MVTIPLRGEGVREEKEGEEAGEMGGGGGGGGGREASPLLSCLSCLWSRCLVGFVVVVYQFYLSTDSGDNDSCCAFLKI